MTLLLGALTPKAIVLGADGAEFRHDPNKPKYLSLTNRKKLLPVVGRPLAIGTHGQNRLVSPGDSVPDQWLLVEQLPGILQEVNLELTVKEVCQQLFSRLTPLVQYTFKTLAGAGIQAAPLGILVVGYDDGVHRPKCFEAWWPLPGHGSSNVAEHPRDSVHPAIMHSGDGAKYAKNAISHGGRYSVNRLKDANVAMTQEYVRRLYAKAESLQPREAQEFTGEYHEVTITPEGAKWTDDGAKSQSLPQTGEA